MKHSAAPVQLIAFILASLTINALPASAFEVIGSPHPLTPTSAIEIRFDNPMVAEGAVGKETDLTVEVKSAQEILARRSLTLRPVRKWQVYLLPHSHVDIGYTQLQTKVERNHWRFIEQSIEASRRTADYPPGAQYKWN